MDSFDRLPESGTIALIATFTARAGHAEAVDGLLAEFAAKVRAEPGNIAFDCYRDAADPKKFIVHEIYRDKAAFAAHIGAASGASFNAALQHLIVEPNSVLTFLSPLTSA
ncbi:MAG: antibiotic biosynthesis monooxygenase [Devosia sp.]|uniref:putative quinol monooxygenase n=1 Tax=Devosia sp. TaxID=1871048 RepID=UPI0024CD0933|nr:putative quinol monooxygenase [Devosia sp.]UYN98173.1 MAG: antibiotic biosynthesis monooxygenase [Devosia sp.]